MRRASIGLLLAAALLLWAPSAWAFRDAESEGRLSGDIVLTWHGDSARGCAAAGLCDVSGSLRYAPDTAFTYGDLAANGRFEPDELDLESGDPTTVRVRRGASSGASGLCLDVEDTSFELSLRRGSGGHYRVGLFGDDREAGGFSSGRCAGPLAQDLATLFPIGTLDTSGLARHSALLDLSGRLPFVAGPFSGELNSTLRARMPRLEVDEESSSSGSASSSVTAEHKERRLNLLIDYRVRSGSGSLAGSFGGTAEPFCLPFDACGVHATLSYAASFAPQSGSVTIYAHRTLGRHEHANLRTALRDLRENRLELEPFVDPPEGAQGRADSSVSLPDGVTCTDRGVLTSVDIGVDRVARGIRFGLNPAGDGGTDALRTHCQGPGQQDIAGAGPLLAATTSYRDVARKSLHLHLRPRASFATSAYSGTLTGSFEMDLTRTALRASVQTAYVSP